MQYLDKFSNTALGKDKFTSHVKTFFTQTGVDMTNRCWHFTRRTFVQGCYRAGMPEIATSRLSRHTSVQGLRAYSG